MKEAQMRSTLLEKFIGPEFTAELLHHNDEFHTFFVYL